MRIGADVSIGAFVTIGARAQIGSPHVVYPNVVIGPGVRDRRRLRPPLARFDSGTRRRSDTA